MPDYDRLAEEQARAMRPDLHPDAHKGHARSFRALVRILSVTNECNDLRQDGNRNAVKVIADRRGMAEVTVRGLLHRAKEQGIRVLPHPVTQPMLSPAARALLRNQYLEILERHCLEGAESVVDELMAAWDTHIEQRGEAHD